MKTIKVETKCPECKSNDLILSLLTMLYKCNDCKFSFRPLPSKK